MGRIPKHTKQTADGPFEAIQIRGDGIAEVCIQSHHRLEPSDIIHLVSNLYELDPSRENTKIIIKSDAKNPLSQEARLFLSNCSSIRAAALVVSKKTRRLWSIPRLFKRRKSGSCALQDFNSSELGERWLEMQPD